MLQANAIRKTTVLDVMRRLLQASWFGSFSGYVKNNCSSSKMFRATYYSRGWHHLVCIVSVFYSFIIFVLLRNFSLKVVISG